MKHCSQTLLVDRAGKYLYEWHKDLHPCLFLQLSLPNTMSSHQYLQWTVVVVPSLSHVWLFATPWTITSWALLSSTVSQSLFKFMSIELVIQSKHLILCSFPLLLPSIFPSIRVFSNESALCIKWPKYWSFSNSPFNEYSRLISFRIGWFDLPAIQWTLKSLLQHHSSKASLPWQSDFFMVQLSHLHDYWKNHTFDYMDLCRHSNDPAF